MFEKAELSEFSDNYPLKTDPETIDFKGFWKGYRRNGISPIKGIDTSNTDAVTSSIGSRNGISPIKGIDTGWIFIPYYFFITCRNGISPIKGIDTSFLLIIGDFAIL